MRDTPYPIIEERIVVPNMSDTLVPSDVVPLEIRTRIEDSRYMHGPSIRSSSDVMRVIDDAAVDGYEATLVLCLTVRNSIAFIAKLFDPGRDWERNIMASVLVSGCTAMIVCPYSGNGGLGVVKLGKARTKIVKSAQQVKLRVLDVVPWSMADGIEYASMLDRGWMPEEE